MLMLIEHHKLLITITMFVTHWTMSRHLELHLMLWKGLQLGVERAVYKSTRRHLMRLLRQSA